jgi:hypothetical protein
VSADLHVGPRGITREQPPPPEVDDATRRGEVPDDDASEVQAHAEPEGFAPEDAADAAGGGLAEQLQARRAAQLQRKAKEFPIPGWDGDLVIEVRPFADRRKIQEGISAELFIAGATHRLKFRHGPGEPWQIIKGKWSPTFAKMLGARADSVSALIRDVFSTPVDGELVENPLALEGFTVELMAWMRDVGDEADADLGE